MKDLGSMSYFLGLEVSLVPTDYTLSQVKYAYNLLLKSGISDNKITSIPLEYEDKLNIKDGELLTNPNLYRQWVGSLIYLIVTRPDIVHAVNIVSQFMKVSRTPHFTTVIRILRYVKETIFHGLHYSFDSPLELHVYSDTDWDGDSTTRCSSITGLCFFLDDSLVSWRNKKQSLDSRSTAESEY